jgi:hypothetical protein
MTQDTNALIQRLIAIDEWPAPQILHDILAGGSEAVPGLCRLLDRVDENERIPIDAATAACTLLGEMRAVEAVPHLTGLFRRVDWEWLEVPAGTLVVMGPDAVDPMLDVITDLSLDWYPRSLLLEALSDLVYREDNPELTARVADVLRQLMETYLAEADALHDDDLTMVSSVLATLANMRNPQDRQLIERAAEAEIIDQDMVDTEYLYSCLDAPDRTRRSFYRLSLSDYEAKYETHLAEQRRERAGKLGRNDPCWCGSGRKYKYCHMRKDQGRQVH